MMITLVRIGFALALAASALAAPSGAGPKTGAAAGTIERVEGPSGEDTVTVKNGEASMAAGARDQVFEQDRVLTGNDQSVTIVLNDGSAIVVGPASEFVVRQAYTAAMPATDLGLLYGMLHALVRKIYSESNPFTVSTPSSVMGVRGTEFVAEYDQKAGESSVHTLDGAVAMGQTRQDLSDPAKSSTISAGMASSFRKGMARPAPPQAFDRAQYLNHLSTVSPRFASSVRQSAARPLAPPPPAAHPPGATAPAPSTAPPAAHPPGPTASAASAAHPPGPTAPAASAAHPASPNAPAPTSSAARPPVASSPARPAPGAGQKAPVGPKTAPVQKKPAHGKKTAPKKAPKKKSR